MTRQELMESIKHLKWTRIHDNYHHPTLRCEKGDCPIIAAAKLKGITNVDNWQWEEAAKKLDLAYYVALEIVREADKGIIPELES